jgi:hypothetical protein
VRSVASTAGATETCRASASVQERTSHGRLPSARPIARAPCAGRPLLWASPRRGARRSECVASRLVPPERGAPRRTGSSRSAPSPDRAPIADAGGCSHAHTLTRCPPSRRRGRCARSATGTPPAGPDRAP